MKTKLDELVTVVGVAAAVAENVAADAVAGDGVAGLRDRGHEGVGWAGSVVVVLEGADLRRTVVGWVGVSGMCVEVVGSP